MFEDIMDNQEMRKAARTNLSKKWFSLSFLYATLNFMPVLILYVALVTASFAIYYFGFDTSSTNGVEYFFAKVSIILMIVYVIASNFLTTFMLALYHDVDRCNRSVFLFSRIIHLMRSKIMLTLLSVQLLVTLKTLLWSTLLIVPGIIKSFSYSQAIFIAFDYLEKKEAIKPSAAILKSEEMMRHQKFNLFRFKLSFRGWLF